MENILAQIKARLPAPAGKQPGPPFLLAIDGRCASGKTTLAARLWEEFSCTVFHMDNFFLQKSQRTPERLNTPGGNVDYVRFLAEILAPLKAGEPLIRYRPFDCQTMALLPEILAEPAGICVVEGSYSCHPSLRDFYRLRIFLTVSPEEQLRRITARSPEKAAAFREKWIPLEERYFSACTVAECCDFCFQTG